MGRVILLTGRPGIGKTTAIRRIVARLPGQAAGFYTDEIRERGRRVGFRLTTLDGREGILAHESIRKGPRVSRYGVNVATLEKLGADAIRAAIASADCIVIDEIGKMELCSRAFREAVQEAMQSDKPVLATIMAGPHPWADEIRSRPEATLFVLTEKDRETIIERVIQLLRE